MSEQKQYVVGFMFDSFRTNVVLIKKNRPEWQAGKLNGVGGKIEQGETPIDAMVREFYEETGVQTYPDDWTQFCVLSGDNAKVYVFKCYNAIYIYRVTTMTDEQIGVYDSRLLNALTRWVEIIPNLMWLIPMASYNEKFLAEVYFDKQF